MADEQLWFIPVTGGQPTLPHLQGTGPIHSPYFFNVQWDSDLYPTTPGSLPAHPIFEVETVTDFQPAAGPTNESPGRLENCHAQFRWDSCSDGEDIILGGQLNVGTVLSIALPTDNSSSQTFETWDKVEVWAKLRISETDRLDSIYMVISDESGNSSNSGDRIADFTDGTWHVIRHEVEPSGWDNTNIRATVSLLGTTNTANVGRITVDFEWFAFRLSNNE